jgi:pyrophosphate--fructose-6-phosphate 1-phosphotransferase
MEVGNPVSVMRSTALLEQHLPKLPLLPCASFVSSTGIRPVIFKHEAQLNTGDDGAVARQFPKITAASWRHVLKADGFNEASQAMRVAVLFSGGPASGGHNVIVGLKHALAGSTLLGVRCGPKGLLAGDFFEITDEQVEHVRNIGGFDLLGTDRTKIKSDEQVATLRKVCLEHKLDAIVVIGGDDSNTNAAVLAEALFNIKPDGTGVQVIGVPKTMDGDVQQDGLLPLPFGFSTATRIYAELVGNILQDTPSSGKYWHFIKLMGRTASHVALEVALQTHPTITFISEEVREQRRSLQSIIDEIADAVLDRASRGMHHGVVVVPEGLLEFIPEVSDLIAEIERVMVADGSYAGLDRHHRREFFISRVQHLLFGQLPHYIQDMLIADRDSHGNLEVSQIPTERLIADMVAARVDGKVKLLPQTHFFGYEGRCGAPTRFDAMLSYNLGLVAGSLVLDGRTGYMAGFTNYDEGGSPVAIPLVGIMGAERRNGKDEFVISKRLVQLDDPAFLYFAQHRDEWKRDDAFASPGPRQFWGPTAYEMPLTVVINHGYGGFFRV